jgi:hypothetical protein
VSYKEGDSGIVVYLGEGNLTKAQVRGQGYKVEGGDQLIYIIYVTKLAQFYISLIEFSWNLFYIIYYINFTLSAPVGLTVTASQSPRVIER